MAVAKISCIYLKKHRFWNNGTCIYLNYAVLASKTSSWVKTDPPILTGSKKRSWSQNLKSLAQKTKIWHNYVFSRRFGKYSFHNFDILTLMSQQNKIFPFKNSLIEKKPCNSTDKWQCNEMKKDSLKRWHFFPNPEI